jgi:mannosyltransferase
VSGSAVPSSDVPNPIPGPGPSMNVTAPAARPVDAPPAPPDACRGSSRRSALALLALIVIAGLALRTYRLTDRSIWFDEAWSWRLAQFPLPEMLTRIGHDVHPPLYYLLLKAWMCCCGASLRALRSLSVLLGGVTLVGVYLFAVAAFSDDGKALSKGRGIGLLAAALVAVSVFQVRYAWEARMYTLGTALAALSSWALFRALHATRHPRRW